MTFAAALSEHPVTARAVGEVAGAVLAGWPATLPFEPQALVVVGDPFSFSVDALVAVVEERYPGLPVVGGMASAAQGPGGNRLAFDDRIKTSGAVAAFLGHGARIRS